MKILNKISERFSRLSNKKRMQIVTAATLTICMLITIPSYAWFNEQKKAAEMFKVQNPNALYINAAHREDENSNREPTMSPIIAPIIVS